MQDTRPLDSFDESLEDYIQLIRLEGLKALSLAKSKISVDLTQAFESQLVELRNAVSDRDGVIVEMRKELEYVEASTSTVVYLELANPT